jgi:hypothetical protein
MGPKRWIDGGIAGMLIIASVYLYMAAREFPMGSDRFPKFILIVIISLAGLMLINTLRGAGRLPAASQKATGFGDSLRPYALFLGIVGYIVSMPLIGFFPATAGWSLILMPVLKATRKKIYLGIATGTIVFIFFLFAYFLNVPLPKGILFE